MGGGKGQILPLCSLLELDTLYYSQQNQNQKMWDPWNLLTIGLGHAGIFIEMPHLNTTTLVSIMKLCPSKKILPAIMLVSLTAFTNQRVFLKTCSPNFRN